MLQRLLDGLRAWAAHHAQNMFATLGELYRHPVSSLMTVGVIGVTLALPAALHVLVSNARDAAGGLDSGVRLSVFMEPGAGDTEARRLGDAIRERDGVAGVEVIGPEEALAEFREHSGFGEALQVLESNPLPPVLVVTPALSHRSPAQAEVLARDLGREERVDLVVLDTEWLARLQALLSIARRSAAVVAGLLAFAVIIIVGNTIRLDIENRRTEIEVVKLVGGSDAFIRRPFLYGGLWYGLAGGVMAWILVSGTLLALDGPVRRLSGLYGSDYGLSGLGPDGVLTLLLAGGALGWAGSWLAVARHLRDIEPV